MLELKDFLDYTIFLLVASIIGATYFLVKDRPYKKEHLFIFTLVILMTILEIIGTVTRSYSINNSIYFNIGFVFLETVLILIYLRWISTSIRIKRWVQVSLVIFTAWFVLNSIFLQDIATTFQNYSHTLGSFLIIFFSVQFFFSIINDEKYLNENLLAIPHFWIATGLLFFYSASFLFFSSMQFLYNFDVEVMRGLYRLVRYLSIMMYLLMGSAFYAPYIFKSNQNRIPQF